MPDIRELLQSKGVPPGYGTKLQEYTLPAIEHDGMMVVDSLKIALYLDETFPETPRLLLDGTLPFYRALQAYTFANITLPVIPLQLPRIAALLDERGAEYFKRTREPIFGAISESINQDGAKANECWSKATPGLKLVNQMLSDNPEGPFVMGAQRTYVDLHLLAIVELWRQSGDDIYVRGVSIAPNLGRLREACNDLTT